MIIVEFTQNVGFCREGRDCVFRAQSGAFKCERTLRLLSRWAKLLVLILCQ
jgi:hypothetical protein